MDWPLRCGVFMAPFHPNGQNPTLALERDLQLVEHLDRVGLKINSVAMRFRADFVGGEFTNADPAIRAQAIELTKQGIDAAAALGSDLVTVWLGFDGYDYTF
ncbi:MAG TPA: hypothetical protein P5193_02695, partial [Microthrixaceae bacterium]|nr:hypothetical protein [Microthrixaceae bacterium]